MEADANGSSPVTRCSLVDFVFLSVVSHCSVVCAVHSATRMITYQTCTDPKGMRIHILPIIFLIYFFFPFDYNL
jgi:hypothetical protein